MKKVVIIGAGQLGSRHLQGLLKVAQKQIIYVLDPLPQSLDVAKIRAEEITGHHHSITFTSDWSELPKEIDLAIVATGANVREKVVSQLLQECTVAYLVLEKILFQDIEAYTVVENLLKKTQTPTWVNHPRRMMTHYQQIKQELAKSKEQVVFQVVGGNWGLACNGLHFIDLCAFLTGAEVKDLDLEWVDDKIHESKRANYIEFTGSIKGKMTDNSSFVITSFDGDPADITITISTSNERWIVQEGRAQKIVHFSKQNGYSEEIQSFVMDFQSALTAKIAEEFYESGKCILPTYEQACASHVPFIEASLKKYIKNTGINTKVCPIT